MSTRRKHLGCAVFNNYIYAVGGRDDCMELSSAERYNPHTNTWSPIVAMTSRRSGVRPILNVYIKQANIMIITFSLVFLMKKKIGWFSSSKWSIICRWGLRRHRLSQNNRSL